MSRMRFLRNFLLPQLRKRRNHYIGCENGLDVEKMVWTSSITMPSMVGHRAPSEKDKKFDILFVRHAFER